MLTDSRTEHEAELANVRAQLKRCRAELAALRVQEAELLMLLRHAENDGGKVVAIQALRGVLDGEAPT